MKKLLLFLFIVGFSVNLFAGDIWLHLLTTGAPITERCLGDKLNSGDTYYIQYEIGQYSWNSSEAGIGQDTLAVNYEWRGGTWFKDGDGSNKQVQADFGDKVFTATGKWYFAARAKADEADAWHYANNTTWGNTDKFVPENYIAVKPLPVPSIFNAQNPISQNTSLFWKHDSTHKNVIVICKEGEYPTAPVNGTSYTVGSPCGGGTVIYKGTDETYNHSGLDDKKHYYYIVCTNNNDYYSDIAKADITLPVEMTAFTAVACEKSVSLKWTTATELNNMGFEIERKTNANKSTAKWEKIGFVPGANNSSEICNYAYTDKDVVSGKYSYRLKQIDAGGKFEYSSEVEVSLNSMPNGFVIEQNYPNPFNPSTTIRFGVENTSNASLKVYDQLGRQVAELFSGLAEGSKMYSVNFDASGLSSGVYFYQLQTAAKTEVRRMMLVK